MVGTRRTVIGEGCRGFDHPAIVRSQMKVEKCENGDLVLSCGKWEMTEEASGGTSIGEGYVDESSWYCDFVHTWIL
ncbi:MAG: hypothetical protein ACRCZI_00510 [Cetobacterium sp.]